MDERQVQIEASEVLLDLGVSFPFIEFRLPFRKKPVVLRATMRRPTLGARIRIARYYLKMGVKAADMEEFDKEQQMAFVAEHGKAMSRIVSYGLLRHFLLLPFIPLVAWALRWFVNERMLGLVFLQFIRCLGTEDFTHIISCLEMTNPMKLSQQKKGS